MKSAYETVFGVDQSKNFEEFKEFKDNLWDKLDHSKFDKLRLENEWMRQRTGQIMEFCEQVEGQPRDDYLEFLNLVKIILPYGQNPSMKVSFRKPGLLYKQLGIFLTIFFIFGP